MLFLLLFYGSFMDRYRDREGRGRRREESLERGIERGGIEREKIERDKGDRDKNDTERDRERG